MVRPLRPSAYRKTGTYESGDVSRRLVFEYVRDYIAAHGEAPSQYQIAAACFMSRQGVLHALNKLEAFGYIKRERGVWRGIRLLRKRWRATPQVKETTR